MYLVNGPRAPTSTVVSGRVGHLVVRHSPEQRPGLVQLVPVDLEGGVYPLAAGTLLPRPVERAQTRVTLRTQDLPQEKDDLNFETPRKQPAQASTICTRIERGLTE